MVAIRHKQASGILTKATGFANSFDFTLNPYSGCVFGCTYCYAAFFAPQQELQDSWGEWVEVKANALDLLKKKRKRPLIDKTIYMSSVTDPYQPIEQELELTRSLLHEMLNYHQIRLVVQTRSPLVTRDIDLLRQFQHVRVNMTVTTDDDAIRKVFEPHCPSIQQRLNAIKTVNAAGIDSCITMTPLLPVNSADKLAHMLLETGIQKFVVQDFHASKQRFVASTGEHARALLASMQWTDNRYQQVKHVLNSLLPHLREGRDGFVPDWKTADC